MGAKVQDQLKTFGFDTELHEARRVIKIYRETNYQINKLWRDAQLFLKDGNAFGKEGVKYGGRRYNTTLWLTFITMTTYSLPLRIKV